MDLQNNLQTSHEKFKGITVEEMQFFIGDNSEYYIKKWDLSENPSKFAGWNWASFFLGVWWLGYRKVYSAILWIIGIFLVTDIISYIFNPNYISYTRIIGFLICIFLGTYGNSIYFRHMLKKVNKIKSLSYPSDIDKQKIEKVGGASWGGVGISILMFWAYGAISYLIQNIIIK